jgi:hypothetical protein
MGSIFNFGSGMYFKTGKVIYVPKWPNGEFVSFVGCILFNKITGM